MKVELKEWTPSMKQELIKVRNSVNRTYLSNRLLHLYTEESADDY